MSIVIKLPRIPDPNVMALFVGYPNLSRRAVGSNYFGTAFLPPPVYQGNTGLPLDSASNFGRAGKALVGWSTATSNTNFDVSTDRGVTFVRKPQVTTGGPGVTIFNANDNVAIIGGATSRPLIRTEDLFTNITLSSTTFAGSLMSRYYGDDVIYSCRGSAMWRSLDVGLTFTNLGVNPGLQFTAPATCRDESKGLMFFGAKATATGPAKIVKTLNGTTFVDVPITPNPGNVAVTTMTFANDILIVGFDNGALYYGDENGVVPANNTFPIALRVDFSTHNSVYFIAATNDQIMYSAEGRNWILAANGFSTDIRGLANLDFDT